MVKGTTNTDKGQRSEKLPPIIHNVARRKLLMIAATKEINIPQTRISEIIHGNRSITADTAIRFSKFFGTTPEFWLNLQNLYDLGEEENKHALEFESIKMYAYA